MTTTIRTTILLKNQRERESQNQIINGFIKYRKKSIYGAKRIERANLIIEHDNDDYYIILF